jgi:ornithine cyclodeaminase
MTTESQPPRGSLLLSRVEVEQLLDPAQVLEGIRKGFVAHSHGRRIPAQRVGSSLPNQSQGRAMVVFPGLMTGIPAYSVKVHAKFPSQQPAIRGVLHLIDLETGTLLALMDSGYLTAVRTSLAAALAADVLARPDADTVAIIGAGVQGRMQLRHLGRVRKLKQARIYDTDLAHATALAEFSRNELGLPAVVGQSLPEVLEGAQVVVTATWSKTPFLTEGMVAKGTHITSLGADEAGKAELDASLIQASLFVADDRDLALAQGALLAAGLGWENLHAELGDILAGDKPGRTDPDQITVFAGMGLPFQDLVAAWSVYQAALAQPQLGARFEFLSDRKF